MLVDKMSRFTLLLFVVAAVALRKVHAETDEEKEFNKAMAPIIAECSKEHGANFEEVTAAMHNKDSEALDGCLLACVFKKIGVMDDEGAFVVDKLVEHTKKLLKKDADSEKLEEAVKNCSSESEKNSEEKCVKSKMMFTCLVEKKAEMHL